MNLKYCISSNWESSLGDGLNLIADKKIGDTIYSGATSILGTSVSRKLFTARVWTMRRWLRS